MKVLSAEEMREVDRLTSERLGIPSLQLMEAAGGSVAEAVRGATADLRSARALTICVLCGKGNNGGDGFVAARHLKQGATRVRVYLFGGTDGLRGDAQTNCRRWREVGGSITPITNDEEWRSAWEELSRADVIIDGMLGTGLRGAASGQMARAIEEINGLSKNARAARPALILAIDTPSGLPSDGEAAQGPVLHAHRTVTFTAPKIGQIVSRDAGAVGALEVAQIGSPAVLVEEVGGGALRWMEPEEFAGIPLVRAAESHKGLYGHVLVIAGSMGKSGAAVMAGYAALCAGAGLVTVATPEPALAVVAAAHPEYMTEALMATEAGTATVGNVEGERFGQMEKGKTVVAMGPGLGLEGETQEFIRAVVRRTELPIILDADGLNAFAGRARELSERKGKFLCITPHPGEMARLLGTTIKVVEADRVKTAKDAAQMCNARVVLKGAHTVIADAEGHVFVNTSGNPGLAKGGSGDVLTGVLGAMTAQFKTEEWTRVLALGVYLHGLAAEIATTANMDESGLLASGVARTIPHARRQVLGELQRRG